MTEADEIAFTAAFDRFFKGNAAAARMCADFVRWLMSGTILSMLTSRFRRNADMAFRKMMLEIPANEFYRANFAFLQPVIVMIWAQWSAANGMETHPFKRRPREGVHAAGLALSTVPCLRGALRRARLGR
jgi:hypothetical protein